MQIKVDKEGLKAVQELCDIALRTQGLQVLNGVNRVLQGTTLIEEEHKNALE